MVSTAACEVILAMQRVLCGFSFYSFSIHGEACMEDKCFAFNQLLLFVMHLLCEEEMTFFFDTSCVVYPCGWCQPFNYFYGFLEDSLFLKYIVNKAVVQI